MVNEIKSLRSLNPMIFNVLYAVCVLFGKKPDPNSVKEIISDTDFISKLHDFNSACLTTKVHK